MMLLTLYLKLLVKIAIDRPNPKTTNWVTSISGIKSNTKKLSCFWRYMWWNAILLNSSSFILQPFEYSLPKYVSINLSAQIWQVCLIFRAEYSTKGVRSQLFEMSTQLKNTTNLDKFIFGTKITARNKVLCGEISSVILFY